MLLTQLHCDGCGRKPNLVEWMKGELGGSGYEGWRHPGIAFKEAGCQLDGENIDKCERLFRKLFGRPMPLEMDFLCPDCFARALRSLPRLIEEDPGDDPAVAGERRGPRHFMG